MATRAIGRACRSNNAAARLSESRPFVISRRPTSMLRHAREGPIRCRTREAASIFRSASRAGEQRRRQQDRPVRRALTGVHSRNYTDTQGPPRRAFCVTGPGGPRRPRLRLPSPRPRDPSPGRRLTRSRASRGLCDHETGGIRADELVLGGSQDDPLRTLRIGALAKEVVGRVLLTEGVGDLTDALVHIPEERLVQREPLFLLFLH